MKRPYNLVGQDGNAFALMAYTRRAMLDEKFSKEDVAKVIVDATSGDYNNLLCVLDDAIQKCNDKTN